MKRLAKKMYRDTGKGIEDNMAMYSMSEEEKTEQSEVKQELEKAITELGGDKPGHQWFDEGKFPERFYHLTALSNVDGILRFGLSTPTTARFSPSMRYGVYLFSVEGDMDVFYDAITYEMYKGQRGWVDLAVIAVTLPQSWPLVIDPEYVEDPDNPYAFISLKDIPASIITIEEVRLAEEAKKWYEEHRPD